MLPTFKSRPKVIGVVMLMMMKDGPCSALLLRLKLSSPHRALVLIKQLLCTKVLSLTSCASSLLFSAFDRFFCFGQYLLLHIAMFEVVLPLSCTFCQKHFFAQKLFKLFVHLVL
jgi:hypothetical protein